MSEVVMNNDSGWPLRALQEIRTFEGVLLVDGRKLLPNGCFKEMVIYLPNSEMAAQFSEAALVVLRNFRA